MLVSTFGKDARTLNSDNDKMNQFKMVPKYQELNMMDMLGDDEPNLRSGISSEREAHAAFSIEGLGKVEMETPVHTPLHSPEVHGRNFLHCCSPVSKAMKPAYSFNLDSELVNLGSELQLLALYLSTFWMRVLLVYLTTMGWINRMLLMIITAWTAGRKNSIFKALIDRRAGFSI